MSDYPPTVSIDVRFTVVPEDLPFLVEQLDEFAEAEGFGIEYPQESAL